MRVLFIKDHPDYERNEEVDLPDEQARELEREGYVMEVRGNVDLGSKKVEARDAYSQGIHGRERYAADEDPEVEED